MLLGKVRIPKTDEDYDMDSKEGKKLTIAAEMNEWAYTELILSIDDKTSNGKLAFNLTKGCKKGLRRCLCKYSLGEVEKQVWTIIWSLFGQNGETI